MRAKCLEGKNVEEVPMWLLGNLYKLCSMFPSRRIFFVFQSLIRKKVGWNSKNKLLLVQNLGTLIRFVARWGMLRNWKDLWGVWNDLEPTCEMDDFLPFPTVTLYLPWYGWVFVRVLSRRERWCVALANIVKKPRFIVD